MENVFSVVGDDREVVIPAAIYNKLSLKRGDQVEFLEVLPGQILFQKVGSEKSAFLLIDTPEEYKID